MWRLRAPFVAITADKSNHIGAQAHCTNAMQQSGVQWPGWSGWMAKGTAANPKRGKNREVKERASSAKQSKTVFVATANTPWAHRVRIGGSTMCMEKKITPKWTGWLLFFTYIVAACTALHTEESNNSQPALTANERGAQRLAQLLHPIRLGRFFLSFFGLILNSFFAFSLPMYFCISHSACVLLAASRCGKCVPLCIRWFSVYTGANTERVEEPSTNTLLTIFLSMP